MAWKKSSISKPNIKKKEKKEKKTENFSLSIPTSTAQSHCDSQEAPAWRKEDFPEEMKFSVPRTKLHISRKEFLPAFLGQRPDFSSVPSTPVCCPRNRTVDATGIRA